MTKPFRGQLEDGLSHRKCAEGYLSVELWIQHKSEYSLNLKGNLISCISMESNPKAVLWPSE